MAIEGKNEGIIPNPAGILLSLEITYSNGAKETLVSDRSWKSTDTPPPTEWKSTAFSDENWSKVRRYGGFKKSFWGQPIAFRHDKVSPTSPPYARASLVQLDPFQKALGRPTRENVSTHRSMEASLLQTLTLSNDQDFHEVISTGAKRWHKAYKDHPQRLIDLLYLEALGRMPNKEEKHLLYPKFKEGSEISNVEDLLWSIILLPEFQFIQ